MCIATITISAGPQLTPCYCIAPSYTVTPQKVSSRIKYIAHVHTYATKCNTYNAIMCLTRKL